MISFVSCGTPASLLQRLAAFVFLLYLVSGSHPGAVYAGTYDVTYSAGAATWRSDVYGQSGSNPYTWTTNGLCGMGVFCTWGVTDDGHGNRVAYSGEVHAESPITAHFTWIPDYTGELPPKSVVVYEHTETTYIDGGSGGGGSGDCNAPLDHPTDMPLLASFGPYRPPDIYGHQKTSYRYSIKQNPGYGFDRTCTPTAHAEGAGQIGPPDINGGGMATAVYFAKVATIDIGLHGTTFTYPNGSPYSGKDNILIGQKCIAGLYVGGNVPDPITFGNHNWTVQGDYFFGMEFGQNNDTGGPITWPPLYVRMSLPNPEWYWLIGGDYGATRTVSCVADALVNGENIGSIQVDKDVQVWNPYFDTRNLIDGKVTIESQPLGFDLLKCGDNTGLGFEMDGAVGTPALFVDAYGDKGVWGWAQLCKLYRDVGPAPTVQTIMTDYQLDSNFLYHVGASSVPDPPGVPYDADSTDRVHKFGGFDDSPQVGINGSNIYVDVHDSFRLYMMYLPPDSGSGVSWVPLLRVDWGWDATASRPIGGGWTPTPPGTVSHNPQQMKYPPVPQWTERYHSG